MKDIMEDNELDQFVWVEKFRPRTIDECILPQSTKDEFSGLLRKRNLPNLILTGTPGVGKTTIARAMCEQLDTDYIILNGSSEMTMETLRVRITNFVTSVSLSGKKKMILVDEADGIKIDTQRALKSFMEEHSANCGWIFTCNMSNKIIEAIQSRCSTINFHLKKEDRPVMAAKFMARIKEILTSEGITFDTKVVAQIVMNSFPDFRKTLNNLQRYASNNVIDAGALTKIIDTDIKDLISAIKEKNFKKVRQWCEDNSDSDHTIIFQKLYETLLDIVNEVPQTVLIIADYSYKEFFVTNKSINLVAACVEIMASCTFK